MKNLIKSLIIILIIIFIIFIINIIRKNLIINDIIKKYNNTLKSENIRLSFRKSDEYTIIHYKDGDMRTTLFKDGKIIYDAIYKNDIFYIKNNNEEIQEIPSQFNESFTTRDFFLSQFQHNFFDFRGWNKNYIAYLLKVKITYKKNQYIIETNDYNDCYFGLSDFKKKCKITFNKKTGCPILFKVSNNNMNLITIYYQYDIQEIDPYVFEKEALN